ncbi:hypothetical protein [Agrilutibacter solisilvae]|uniref:Uncharacterized protein n=1 Tax=Agrilutibacter solisilvae TaxID=2763317 RepID=A0A975ATV4_9GAMM|nr:hypothetical protein [Lysobacter solisilvae]QSX79733.1 hypothetical protein I8J32_007825 [Lysobacter solisilvae]
MLLALLILLAVKPAIAEGVHTVPVDIRDHFKSSGCSEITDYYSESRVIEKPYMYRVKSVIAGREVDNDYSFIAWCRSNKKDNETQYILVGQLGGGTWPGGCKLPIREFDYAGGLSVKVRSVDLSAFTDLARRSVGKNSARGPVIRSERDGLVYEVFCHRKSWVRRSTD